RAGTHLAHGTRRHGSRLALPAGCARGSFGRDDSNLGNPYDLIAIPVLFTTRYSLEYAAMPIDYDKLLALKIPDVVQRYGPKDCMLYALGVGLGLDPLDEEQLAFVYEKNLKALPTMAVVLGYPGFWAKELDTGIDWVKLVAG